MSPVPCATMFCALNSPTQIIARKSLSCKPKVAVFSYYFNKFLPLLWEFLKSHWGKIVQSWKLNSIVDFRLETLLSNFKPKLLTEWNPGNTNPAQTPVSRGKRTLFPVSRGKKKIRKINCFPGNWFSWFCHCVQMSTHGWWNSFPHILYSW